jgi:hypothetical protein
VCGLALGTTIVSLAVDDGPNPATLVFSDPGLHEPCAQASMVLRPYIQRERVPHRAGARPGKPGWLWVASASYELVPGRGSAMVTFRPGPAEAIRQFEYAPQSPRRGNRRRRRPAQARVVVAECRSSPAGPGGPAPLAAAAQLAIMSRPPGPGGRAADGVLAAAARIEGSAPGCPARRARVRSGLMVAYDSQARTAQPVQHTGEPATRTNDPQRGRKQ